MIREIIRHHFTRWVSLFHTSLFVAAYNAKAIMECHHWLDQLDPYKAIQMHFLPPLSHNRSLDGFSDIDYLWAKNKSWKFRDHISSHLDAQDYIRQLPSLKNQPRAEAAACDQAQENVDYLATQADLDSQCMVNHTSRAKKLPELH